jgi:glycosyltransferase involved in cell wall biosynthesis
MKIVVDARTLIGEIAGVANFLKLAILSLSKHKDIDIILLSPIRLNESLDDKFPSNVKTYICPLLGIRRLPKLIWLMVMMPLLVRKHKADVYYSPTPSIPYGLPKKICKLVTVHDVVNVEFPETMTWNNKISNQIIFKRSITSADLLWANSHYTKGKIEEYFPKRVSSTIFVGCSIDTDIFHPLDLSPSKEKELKNHFGITKNFILFVGSLEPRKNLQFLLSLVPELYARHHLQLVIVGAKGWKNSEIYEVIESASYPGESTIFTGFVSNEELVKLYNLAECFVSTSLNEGFGMPQLEALMCGCPVVTAHNSAMIEVVSGFGSTVVGWNPKAWIEAIISQLKNRETNIDVLKRKYSWDEIVDELLRVLEFKRR